MKYHEAAPRGSVDHGRLFNAGILTLGTMIGLVMVFNSQLSGDQFLMLNLGWQLTHNNEWIHHGMATSGGGYSPGTLTSVMVGLQLAVWNDYRSPALFTLIFNLAATILLMAATRDTLTPKGRLLLLWLLWLSPWHLYFSSHIWDPNYMFVFAVLHLVTAQQIAQRREVWSSALHFFLLILGIQLHTSAAVLGVMTALLVVTRRLQIHWGGASLGMALGLATLMPWLNIVEHDPAMAPGGKGFILRGLVYVYPVMRGIIYWLQIGSMSVVRRMTQLDFTPLLGSHANYLLQPLSKVFIAATHLSLPLCAWLQWRFFRNLRRRWRVPADIHHEPRRWLRQYVTFMFIAAVVSFALSPSTIMFWQVLVALPASALVVVMSCESLVRTGIAKRARQTIQAFCALGLVVLLMQSVAAPMYRCGGYELQAPNDILKDTRVPKQCTVQQKQP